MLAVRVPVEKVYELLPSTLSVAAINSKQFCVVSGTKQDISDFNQKLDAQDIPNKLLVTSHAFHSSMMDPILDAFKNELEKIKLSIPRLPIISTVSGTWLTDTEATSPMYWVNHLKNTVRFADAMDTAFELEDYVLLEVGPGQTLTTLARQQAVGKIIAAFPSLTIPKEEQENEYTTVLNALGELWIRGINPDWKAFYTDQQRQKIDLPSYVFDRKLCWIEPLINNQTTLVQKSIVTDVPLVTNTPLVAIKTDSNSVKTNDSRKDSILIKISEIIKNASGITYELDSASNTFLELGLDSLSLTQLSGRLKKEFNLPITFRQLNEGFKTPSLLADYLDLNLPEEEAANFTKENEVVSNQTIETVSLTNEIPVSSNQSQISLEQIVQQIQLLSQKIDQLQNHQNTVSNVTTSITSRKTETLVSNEFTNENQISTNGVQKHEKKYTIMADESPVLGSKLGRDENGNPAWFIADSNQKGEFIKIKSLES
jgi:acyl transferase domain-containing protein